MIEVKSSFPAIRKMTVLMVLMRVYPRALRFAAWNRPLTASMNPLVWRDLAQLTTPSKWLRIIFATTFIGSTFERMTLVHH